MLALTGALLAEPADAGEELVTGHAVWRASLDIIIIITIQCNFATDEKTNYTSNTFWIESRKLTTDKVILCTKRPLSTVVMRLKLTCIIICLLAIT